MTWSLSPRTIRVLMTWLLGPGAQQQAGTAAVRIGQQGSEPRWLQPAALQRTSVPLEAIGILGNCSLLHKI